MSSLVLREAGKKVYIPSQMTIIAIKILISLDDDGLSVSFE